MNKSDQRGEGSNPCHVRRIFKNGYFVAQQCTHATALHEELVLTNAHAAWSFSGFTTNRHNLLIAPHSECVFARANSRILLPPARTRSRAHTDDPC